MKETFIEEPRKVAVSKGKKNWTLTLNLGIKAVEGGYECESVTVELDHRPTVEDVRNAFIDYVDKQTDERILSGMVWNGKPVWLSSESQFNFKAAHDLAVQTEGANLPVTFKLGEEEGRKPVYHTFEDFVELTDFYTSSVKHILDCLNEGWQEKDSFDAEEYEKLLNG